MPRLLPQLRAPSCEASVRAEPGGRPPAPGPSGQVALESRGDQVVSLASREAGDPYVYGAAGPDAFDCSGFTQYVYAQLGISLPHSSAAQVGYTVQVSDPQPGDLVFFTGSGGVYHVAIYAGDGMIGTHRTPGPSSAWSRSGPAACSTAGSADRRGQTAGGASGRIRTCAPGTGNQCSIP